jgi:hypothetical protein
MHNSLKFVRMSISFHWMLYKLPFKQRACYDPETSDIKVRGKVIRNPYTAKSIQIYFKGTCYSFQILVCTYTPSTRPSGIGPKFVTRLFISNPSYAAQHPSKNCLSLTLRPSRSRIIAREGVVVVWVWKAIIINTGRSIGVTGVTIVCVVKITHARALIAVGDVDAGSIVVPVTVATGRRLLIRPCHRHLALIVFAFAIRVVVQLHLLRSWADSQQDSQTYKAEKLHNGAFEALSTNVREQQHKGGFSGLTVFVYQDTVARG